MISHKLQHKPIYTETPNSIPRFLTSTPIRRILVKDKIIDTDEDIKWVVD